MDTYAKSSIFSHLQIVFFCLIFFTIDGCGSGNKSGSQNIGWVTVTEPNNLENITVNDLHSIDLAGEFFESPLAGWKTSWVCTCVGFSCLFGNPGCEKITFYSYGVRVTITNTTTGYSIRGNLSSSNNWSATIPIIYGQNIIEVHVQDANQNWATENITIHVKDSIPPIISSRSPEANATNVATTTDIIIRFAEPLNPSSIGVSNVSLTGNGEEISGSITFNESTYELVFNPQSPLLYNTTYSATANSSITDINGTSLLPESWEFTTIPMAVTPTVKTKEVTDISETAATLWGSVSPNYGDTVAWFEWGTDSNLSSYSETTKITISALSGNTVTDKPLQVFL